MPTIKNGLFILVLLPCLTPRKSHEKNTELPETWRLGATVPPAVPVGLSLSQVAVLQSRFVEEEILIIHLPRMRPDEANPRRFQLLKLNLETGLNKNPASLRDMHKQNDLSKFDKLRISILKLDLLTQLAQLLNDADGAPFR